MKNNVRHLKSAGCRRCRKDTFGCCTDSNRALDLHQKIEIGINPAALKPFTPLQVPHRCRARLPQTVRDLDCRGDPFTLVKKGSRSPIVPPHFGAAAANTANNDNPDTWQPIDAIVDKIVADIYARFTTTGEDQ